MAKKYVEITCDTIERETEKAMFIDGAWYPKSQFMYVMNWNHLDTNNNYEIKPSERKAIYTMLCPLWLYRKNNSAYAESMELDAWTEAYNRDDRVNFKYEALRIVNFEEYVQILNDSYEVELAENMKSYEVELAENMKSYEVELAENMKSYEVQLSSLYNDNNEINCEKLNNVIINIIDSNFKQSNFKSIYKSDYYKEYLYYIYRIYRIDLRVDSDWYYTRRELKRISSELISQKKLNELIEKVNNTATNEMFLKSVWHMKKK